MSRRKDAEAPRDSSIAKAKEKVVNAMDRPELTIAELTGLSNALTKLVALEHKISEGEFGSALPSDD